jgi:murein L,D-transpeptidase YcbB/YkuD
MMMTKRSNLLGGIALLAAPFAAEAQAPAAPQDILPPAVSQKPAQPAASPTPTPLGLPAPAQQSAIQQWSVADAKVLLSAIEKIGEEGLDPADYQPQVLRDALGGGKGDALNRAASTSFAWLVEDIRDGRTPMSARVQWFVVDTDADKMPTAALMTRALETHDVTGVLADLAPSHPDYARLKQELAATPKADTKKRALIRANMDRWRWLPRDLGKQYLITNVPEMQLRLTVNNKIIRTYRTIVGKPGKTATPQLAEIVEGVIFNPTWTVPQSIVKGEGLGARLLASPASAKAQGYKVTRGPDGYVSVVQQPGPNNSLGLVKLDMPNPHAIFLHDTPNRNLFNQDNRALSHGCIRTERALEMAITMAIIGGGASADEAVAISKSREYTRVAMTKQVPVYIAYFTMAQDINGKLTTFSDLYSRDAPVLASFQQARQMNRARQTDEKVVEIVDDLQT